MDGSHFDAIARNLSDGATTRRVFGRGLVGSALAAVLGLVAPERAEGHNPLAACRRIKQKRRRARCIRRARRHNAAHRTPRPVAPPLPRPPPACVADECPDPGLCKVRACAGGVCAPEDEPNGTSCGSNRETCLSGLCCPFLDTNCFGICLSHECQGHRGGGCNDRCQLEGRSCCGPLTCRRTESGVLRCRP